MIKLLHGLASLFESLNESFPRTLSRAVDSLDSKKLAGRGIER